MTVNVTVRMPDDLHAWLTQQADSDRRSLNAEILWLIEQTRQKDQS